MADKTILLNTLLGIVIACIIIFSAFTFYNQTGGLTPVSEYSYKELGESDMYGKPAMQELSTCPTYSILLIYMNISSSKYEKVVLNPTDIVVSYSDGEKTIYPKTVFLSDKFTLSKDENTLMAAIVVRQGVISNIHIEGSYMLSDSTTDRFSSDWVINLEISSCRTISLYLSIKI